MPLKCRIDIQHTETTSHFHPLLYWHNHCSIDYVPATADMDGATSHCKQTTNHTPTQETNIMSTARTTLTMLVLICTIATPVLAGKGGGGNGGSGMQYKYSGTAGSSNATGQNYEYQYQHKNQNKQNNQSSNQSASQSQLRTRDPLTHSAAPAAEITPAAITD